MGQLTRIPKNSQVKARFTIYDADQIAAGVAPSDPASRLALTNFTVIISLRALPGQGALLKQWTTGQGIVHEAVQDGATKGQGVLTIAMADTAALTSGTAYIDVRVKDGSNVEREALPPRRIEIAATAA